LVSDGADLLHWWHHVWPKVPTRLGSYLGAGIARSHRHAGLLEAIQKFQPRAYGQL
jgi:hypothetical protein